MKGVHKHNRKTLADISEDRPQVKKMKLIIVHCLGVKANDSVKCNAFEITIFYYF